MKTYGRLFPFFFKKKEIVDFIVITPEYPEYTNLYKFQFLHRRVVAYKKCGKTFKVFRFSKGYKKGKAQYEGIDFETGTEVELKNLLKKYQTKTIFVHYLIPNIWKSLKKCIKDCKLYIWVHGSEIEPIHRRPFDVTDKNRDFLEKVSKERIALWNEVFSSEIESTFIAPSWCFREQVIEDFPIAKYSKWMIIPNFIDCDLFTYAPKKESQRLKILSIRPYASLAYANDLSVDAVAQLSKEPFFSELEFRFIGDGTLFEETLEPLKSFSNVIIERKFLQQSEIAQLHQNYGVFLVPTRHDTQGVSRDEAMSSGLVPITNKIPVIKEFCDENSAVLVLPENYVELAEGIKSLYYNPDKFKKMSEESARCVRSSRSYDFTIKKELELLYD